MIKERNIFSLPLLQDENKFKTTQLKTDYILRPFRRPDS